MTTCPLCHDGLLDIFLRPGDPKVFPYASPESVDYEAAHRDEPRAIAVCSCEAGDRHPKAWPRWYGSERRATAERKREFHKAGDVAPEEESDTVPF